MELKIEEFEDLLKYKEHKKILIRNNEGKIIRECQLIFMDNHYDWDKNRVEEQPYNRCRWNGKDKIWEWHENMLKEGGFNYYYGNTLEIYSKELQLRGSTKYNYVIQIKDDEIMVSNTILISESAKPIRNCYDLDVIQKSIQTCINNIEKMDISLKVKKIVMDTIKNAIYIYDEDWKGYKPIKPDLKMSI